MKINLSQTHSATPGVPSLPPATSKPSAPSPFSQIFDSLKRSGAEHELIQKMGHGLMSQKEMAPKDLLRYQLTVNAFHLKVELASKVTESANATIKRLQNG